MAAKHTLISGILIANNQRNFADRYSEREIEDFNNCEY